MNKLNFIFLCAVYISISILSFSGSYDVDTLLLCCGGLIALVGIPHGSIDHILFMEGRTMRPIHFYCLYIATMVGYAIVWYLNPLIALLIFLLLSAYHFGESQLTKVLSENTKFKSTLYLVWGVNILAALVLYNITEVVQIFSQYHDLKPLVGIFNKQIYTNINVLTSLFLIGLGIVGIRNKSISMETFLKELYILTLIHISFILLPVLLGFTLYFIILHSAKVLIEEYNFLDFKIVNLNFKSFILKLLPLTVISLLGSLFLTGLIYFEIICMSYLLLFTILISVITLPHSIVMNSFYHNKS